MSRSIRFFLLISLVCFPAVLARADGPQLAHMVFFQLKKDSPEAREALITACRKYLSGHEGTVYFSVGARADEFNREVNDQDFDVALHVVFRDRAAHDRYQSNERHLKFIEEHGDAWSKVRVFDSYLTPARDSDAERAPEARDGRRLPLPDAAAGFAGMVRGKVVQLRDQAVVVQIEQIIRAWEHSQAEDAQSLVGKRIVIDGVQNDLVVSFLRRLKVGDQVTLDVAHREGERLTLLELTEEQRQAVRP